MVNLSQLFMRSLNSGMEILLAGSSSKIRLKILFSSVDRGRMDFRNLRSLMYALKVESSKHARFHGLRPHVKFTRMTPSDQMSFGAEA